MQADHSEAVTAFKGQKAANSLAGVTVPNLGPRVQVGGRMKLIRVETDGDHSLPDDPCVVGPVGNKAEKLQEAVHPPPLPPGSMRNKNENQLEKRWAFSYCFKSSTRFYLRPRTYDKIRENPTDAISWSFILQQVNPGVLPGGELLAQVAALVEIDPPQVVQVVLQGQGLPSRDLLPSLSHAHQIAARLVLPLLMWYK